MVFNQIPLPKPKNQSQSMLKVNIQQKFKAGDSTIVASNTYPPLSIIFRYGLDVVRVCCSINICFNINRISFVCSRHYENS